MNRPERMLCVNGAVIMFSAFVSGGMIGIVAMGQVEGSVEGWKLAHMEPLLNSLVLFAVAGIFDKLVLSPSQQVITAWSLVIMAYCNTLFGYMRATTGALGYQFDDSLANNITAFAGMLGVPMAIIGFSLILLGSFRAREQRNTP